MKFTKMNGAGNDFLILDGIRDKLDPGRYAEYARVLCERHLSIGADGMRIVLPAELPGCDYRMLFLNSDGSLGEMCGNGARCICRYGYETGLAGETQAVQTTAGIVTGKRIDRRNYRIRLNDPSVIRNGVMLRSDDKMTGAVSSSAVPFAAEASYVELGDPGIPHAVVDYLQLKDLTEGLSEPCERVPLHKLSGRAETILREIGRTMRYDAAFPKGANVNFYVITGPDELEELTYERGVEDFTYACGTGTGSVVKILADRGLVSGKDVKVHVRGGLLKIDLEEDGDAPGIYLTGPTNIVASGTVTDEDLTDETPAVPFS